METMAEKKLYEGMFLVDSAKAASDWDGVNSAIKKILDRAKAEIVSIRKWDDRKLAYDIKSTSRGTYLLCYFKVDGSQIQNIEKAVQLSEVIIRTLILNTDQMTQEDIEKDTPAMKAEKEQEKTTEVKAPASEESPQDEQEEIPAVEDASTTEESPTADEAQAPEQDQTQIKDQVEQADKPEEAESTEEAGQAEEQQDTQPKVVSED